MTNRVTALDQLKLAFADRFNARDLDGPMALNTADVVFVPAPGAPVTGAALPGTVSSNPTAGRRASAPVEFQDVCRA